MIAADLSTDAFRRAHERVRAHAHHTPLLGSRALSDATGLDVRLKAESFQRTGSYKIRGPLNKLALLDESAKQAGVICSSAGNHAQGVALAAAIHGLRAVVVMAENATRRRSRRRGGTAPRSFCTGRSGTRRTRRRSSSSTSRA